jgi:hypothetical protein
VAATGVAAVAAGSFVAARRRWRSAEDPCAATVLDFDDARTFKVERPDGAVLEAVTYVATALSISGVVGAFGGVPAGPTRVGGIDFLGSLAVAASTDHGDLELKSRPSMMGIGVRLGLMQETPSLPAVSFTSMVHAGSKFSMKTPRLPTDTQEGVVLRLENGDLSTLGLRLGASKTFGAFGVSGGAGRTIYFIDSDYSVDGTGSLGYGNQNITFTVRRTNAFVGATYTRKRLTFGAELGRLMGGDVSETLNTFGDGANAAHNYLSLGIRIPAGRSISK